MIPARAAGSVSALPAARKVSRSADGNRRRIHANHSSLRAWSVRRSLRSLRGRVVMGDQVVAVDEIPSGSREIGRQQLLLGADRRDAARTRRRRETRTPPDDRAACDEPEHPRPGARRAAERAVAHRLACGIQPLVAPAAPSRRPARPSDGRQGRARLEPGRQRPTTSRHHRMRRKDNRPSRRRRCVRCRAEILVQLRARAQPETAPGRPCAPSLDAWSTTTISAQSPSSCSRAERAHEVPRAVARDDHHGNAPRGCGRAVLRCDLLRHSQGLPEPVEAVRPESDRYGHRLGGVRRR